MILSQAVLALIFMHAAFCDENNGASSESVEYPSIDKQKQGVAIPGFGNLGGVPGAGILPGQQPAVRGVVQPVVPGLPGTGVGAPVVPGVPGVPPQPVVPGLPGLGGTNGALPGFGGLPGVGQPGIGGLTGVGVPGVNNGNLPAAGAGGFAGVLGVPAAAGRK